MKGPVKVNSERIKALLKAKGWTRVRLADEIYYSSQAITVRIREGKMPQDMLEAVAKALNTTAEDITA